MSVYANNQGLATLQSQDKMDGVVFDTDGAALEGFVAGSWVPDHCRVDTKGIQSGKLLTRNQDHLYRAGMSGMRGGLADGAPRPSTPGRTMGEVSFSTKRKAADHRLLWNQYADYYKRGPGGHWGSPENEMQARGWAIDQETDAAEAIQASLLQQDEWDLLTTLAGTDLAGTGALVPTAKISTQNASTFAGGGSASWNDEKFPWLEYLEDVLDYLQDLSDKSTFDLLIDRKTARRMARSLQMVGIRMITGGTVAEGYAEQAVMASPVLQQRSVIARLTGIERIGRVVVSGARAEFAAPDATSDKRYLMPEMLHFCHFGRRAPKMVQTNVGKALSAKDTGMIEVVANRTPFFRHEDGEKRFAVWAAEKRSGFNPTDTSCTLSIFNA